MNRLKTAFQNRTETLLMTFIVAGDPTLQSLEIIRAVRRWVISSNQSSLL